MTAAAPPVQPAELVPRTGLLLRTTPVVVWLLVALTAAAGLVATVFYPNFRGPDEINHVDLVTAVAERSVDWEPGMRFDQLGIQRGPLVRVGRVTTPLALNSHSMPPRGARPSFDALGGAEPTHFKNQLVQHPPLYYFVLGSVLSVVPHWQTMPLDRIVWFLRFLTLLMLVPVPWFCWAAARTLGGGNGVATAAAAVPLMSPQLLHISATVNNDGLVTLFGAWAVWLAARVFRGDLSRRTALHSSLVCAGMALTKGFGLVVALLVVATYLVALWRFRRAGGFWRPFWRCTVWFAPAVLFASTWWIANEVKYHKLLPDGTLTASQQHVNHFPPHTTFAKSGWRFVRGWVDDFAQRFWFDDPSGIQSHRVLHTIALVVTVLAVACAVAVFARGNLHRGFAALLVASLAVTALELMRLAWTPFASVLRVSAAQGRYFFALITAIALLIAFGLRAAIPSERWVARSAVTAAVLLQVAGAVDTLRVYWLPLGGGAGSLGDALRSLLYVSPLPSWVLVPLLLVVIGLTVAVALAVWAPEWSAARWRSARARLPRRRRPAAV